MAHWQPLTGFSYVFILSKVVSLCSGGGGWWIWWNVSSTRGSTGGSQNRTLGDWSAFAGLLAAIAIPVTWMYLGGGSYRLDWRTLRFFLACGIVTAFETWCADGVVREVPVAEAAPCFWDEAAQNGSERWAGVKSWWGWDWDWGGCS